MKTKTLYLYDEVRKANPKANHATLVRLLAARVREDEDALLAAADYVATSLEEEAAAKRRQ